MLDYLKIKRRQRQKQRKKLIDQSLYHKMANSASQYLPASDEQIQTDTHKRTHLTIQTTHTNPKHMQSPLATDKALCRCTFCVVEKYEPSCYSRPRYSESLPERCDNTQQLQGWCQNRGVLTRQKQCADQFNLQQQGQEQAVNVVIMGEKQEVRSVNEVVCLDRQASRTGAEASVR